MIDNHQFPTFPQGQFCGNASTVENSSEFTTSLLKTLRVSNIPTKPFSIYRYNFCYILVKVYADLPRKFIRLLTLSVLLNLVQLLPQIIMLL